MACQILANTIEPELILSPNCKGIIDFKNSVAKVNITGNDQCLLFQQSVQLYLTYIEISTCLPRCCRRLTWQLVYRQTKKLRYKDIVFIYVYLFFN